MSDVICAQCGVRWSGAEQTTPAWCTAECADSWMDAHPEEKRRLGWITRSDAVDRMLARVGLLPVHRASPERGDN